MTLSAGAAQHVQRSDLHSRPVQVETIRPMLKAPGTKRLKQKYDEPLSAFAFNANLRRYSTEDVVECPPCEQQFYLCENSTLPYDTMMNANYESGLQTSTLLTYVDPSTGRNFLENLRSADDEFLPPPPPRSAPAPPSNGMLTTLTPPMLNRPAEPERLY